MHLYTASNLPTVQYLTTAVKNEHSQMWLHTVAHEQVSIQIKLIEIQLRNKFILSVRALHKPSRNVNHHAYMTNHKNLL